MNPPCPVCGFDKVLTQLSGNGDSTEVQCPRCGRFTLTGTATMLVPKMERIKRDRLSGVLRNASDNGEALVINSSNVDTLLARAPATLAITRLIDGILLLIADRAFASGEIRRPVLLYDTDYTPFYLSSWGDFVYVVEMMSKQGFLNMYGVTSNAPVNLTVTGWQRVDELQSTRGRADQAFVAMWFDDALKPAYADGIERALVATGYDPLRIDLLPHTERIDDKILAEIRRSGLLIADFTGQRQGVYFEAGFALGLSIPVIWCCRQDDMEKSHFDTRQYNHIVWTDPGNLHTQLESRIRALGFARK
jgi:nucleoside 2-deoxyribosyltransferase